MTTKIDSDTSDGLKITSDTSGILDIQSAGTTKMTVGSTIDIQGNELVLDADGDSSIHSSVDDQIDFKTSGTDRMQLDSSGNLKFNSGYGSVTTAFGVRAWVNFNGTGTVAIRASGGVSSIADRGTGKYTVVLSFHMPDNNFCGVATAIDDISSTDNRNRMANAFTEDTNDVYVNAFTTGGSLDDVEQVNVVIVR